MSEPVWNIRHELSAGVLAGGPVTLTEIQARALLARLDELEAIEQRLEAGADLQPQGMGDVDEVTAIVREARYYLTGKS